MSTQTIVNTVNCIGVMGAGLALEFRLRYPRMHEDYVERCDKNQVHPGVPYLYRAYEAPWILNFPTKDHWRNPSRITWIERGLNHFITNYKQWGVTSAAFPKLGTNKGGLDWNEIKALMEKKLQSLPIKVHICLNQEDKASGVERKMIETLNEINEHCISSLGIRSDIARKIVSALPIYRFYKLLGVKGVGKQSYEKIFRYLYNKVSKENQNGENRELSLI